MKNKISTLLIVFCTNIFAQVDIKNIVPLSPNVAAIAKYGEIPVSNFTGTANVSLPIYTIKTNEFNLPLELSYHTGGNKVEEVASWVGLGWSLGTIPVISRSVSGLPDEGSSNGTGFFTKFQGYTTKELVEMPSGNTIRQQYFDLLSQDAADSEPDVFYFNLLGKNGKFFFDQQQGKFVTLENSQIKITYNSSVNSFTAITEEGLEYLFSEKETTFNNNEGTTTSWYVSKITSPNKNESIVFEYNIESQSLRTLTPKTKLFFKDGIPSDVSQFTNLPLSTTTTVIAQLLKKISFNGGHVEFNRNTISRLDLQGAYCLKNIKVKDLNNNDIFNYDFEYKYITGASNEQYTNKWMLLEKFKNISSSSSTIEHSFYYDETTIPPSRTSPAQDYWGYYNGAISNQDLVPTVFLPVSSIEILGADRSVDPSYSQFGILKKIIYPTAGYTEFDFENNDTYSASLPDQYLDDQASIEGCIAIGLQNYYETSFIINVPPDPFLNNNNSNGGTYGGFSMGCEGCNLINGVVNANINFSLMKEASPTSPASFYYISSNFRTYLPNGTYKLAANINSEEGANVNDFFVSIVWKKLNPNTSPQLTNKYIGGLRVKEIRNYAGIAAPIVKKYKYKLDYNSEVSSGKVFSEPKFVFGDVIAVPGGCANGVCGGQYYRYKSYNNIQQISFSGSSVGYETVIQESNGPLQSGVAISEYTHSIDFSINQFPFPPPISFELHRGQPKEISYFKKNNLGPLILVEVKDFEFNTSLSNEQIAFFKTLYGYKIGRWNYATLSTSGFPLPFSETHVIAPYEIPTDISLMSSEKTTSYTNNGNLIFSKSYIYSSQKHLKLTSQSTTSSTGKILETKYAYPQDLQSKPFVNELIAINRIATPLVTQTLINNVKLSEQETVYDQSTSTSNLLLPRYIYANKGTANIAETDKKITYDKYDNKGNIQQYTTDSGAPVVIIWGCNQTQPLAKIENATYSSINASLITAAQTASNTGTEATLLTALNAIRTALPNAMVTTYIHIPLIGVSTITDPKGDKITYTYDSFNRLQFVKDKDGNILSENEYHYKN